MKVLHVNPVKFKTAQTGDATQSKETIVALRKLGVEVRQIFADGNPMEFYSDSGDVLSISDVDAIAADCDVVHFIPAAVTMIAFWRKNISAKTPIAVSTIFWGGWERILIAWKTQSGIQNKMMSMMVFHLQMNKRLMNFKGVDLFLPNSKAEAECVRKFWGHTKGAKFVPVVNGWVPPTFDFDSLERPSSVPVEDYIVVPAVFAPRKNQLGLIKALKNTDYKIVFMGGSMDDKYLEECKKHATDNMVFIDYKSSKDKEFWAIVKHSRCACLSSDCETPGIALLEASFAGARPIVTKHGGTKEYYGEAGEYLDPCSSKDILRAVESGWKRGRLSKEEAEAFTMFSWEYCAEQTKAAYEMVMDGTTNRH